MKKESFTKVLTVIVALLKQFEDVPLVLGFASVVYGVYLVHEPAAFIVGGSLLILGFYPWGRK